MKKYYSKKLKILKLKRMNLQSIRKSMHHAFFPVKFKNEKIEKLHDFISQNDRDAEYWQLNGLLGEFINIIKNFNQAFGTCVRCH